jgi:hypothetical protein
MKLVELEVAVRSHTGQLHCERINNADEKKIVEFRHVVTTPVPGHVLPDIGRLTDFYDTFGSVVFYVDEKSGDAAKHIANPDQWTKFSADFNDWLDPLGEDERAEILPEWIESCLVIGEEPRTGNYILMPTTGDVAGHVFLFDHDGYEFTECANDLVNYVERLLAPDDALLLEIATHMRFIEGDPKVQWWIRELRDNRGNVARTNL